METTEFDATLGGTEQLPDLANSLKFAAARSVEIAAMTESILRPSKTKLIFQSLPVHMRRRVMSHNSKRLPRKLRQGHMEQLKKSGLPPKLKRPSRKYRRRPGNLLEEYNRRQRKNLWLETHIWHAKRFHMIERWGHRLAYAPCDKAFRACYRASSAHCLMQDISYYTPIQIKGQLDDIKVLFSSVTNSTCGLGICAKAFINGNRHGNISLYKPNKFPFGFVGKVNFIWVPTDAEKKSLWLFVHPSQTKEVECILTDIICGNNTNDEYEPNQKQRKLNSHFSENIQMKLCPGAYNVFRLTGPNSHAILAHTLKCVENIEKITSNKWISQMNGRSLHLPEKYSYWMSINKAISPSQLPSRVVIGLVVKDPRLSRPTHRTKAKNQSKTEPISLESLINIPPNASNSPIWDLDIHDKIKMHKLSNTQFIEHVTKSQLVPGAIFEDDPKLQCVPVVTAQRPGSQDANVKKIGYGSGWDIIIPSGYGMQFWQTFIMFGARSGGLRETESLAFEMGETYLPPDSCAGAEEEKRVLHDLRQKYFRLPPSKRNNYVKIGINSPFSCNWKLLLKEWSQAPVDDFYVLRDKLILSKLQECINTTKELPQVQNSSSCLVAVYIQMASGGSLKRHALICLPENNDLVKIKSLMEPHHEDPNEKLRKQIRIEHKNEIKRSKKIRSKLKKKNNSVIHKCAKQDSHKPSNYVLQMQELWLPSEIKTVRHSCSKQVMGYLSQGAFSFSEAKSCGIGYIAYSALDTLLKHGRNQVLVRNVSSRKYRIGNIRIIKDV